DDPPRARESHGDYERSTPIMRVDRERIVAHRARLLRRVGRHDDALEAWQDLARGGGPHAITAWIEVAKALEHRARDPAGALTATRAAQAAVERARFLGRPMLRLEDDRDVTVADGEQRIARAGFSRRRGVRPAVDPLHAPRLASAEAIAVDLLENGFGRHVVDVMLVGRPARPVARRRQDLDEEQSVG